MITSQNTIECRLGHRTKLAPPPLSANFPFVVSHLSQCLHAMIKNSKIYARKFRVLEARPVVGHAKLMRDLEECRTGLRSLFLKLQAKLSKLQDRAHWCKFKTTRCNYHNSPKTALLTLRDAMQKMDQQHRKRISEMEKDVATVEILEGVN
ncbi:hypothetical protein BYT27DRAFT_7219192 [Phlegmacium glaucopus]|nr:hypothetical protein BYT27DRAFT_7219192 [Phlegmacium glaucopus]